MLKALDGHPLSIELLAANARGKPDLKGLAADWTALRADLLRSGAANDRRTSLRASLDLSLAALDPPSPAHRLIRLMALLPDGMSEADSRTILSDGEPTRAELGAAARLEAARLARRASSRWRLLSPIRETLLADFPPETEDRARLVNVFLRRAALGNQLGTDKWSEVREELVAEAGNLDSIISVSLLRSEIPQGAIRAVEGLATFHIMTGLPSCASLPAVAKRFHDAGELLSEASCIRYLGDIAFQRSDHDGARRRFEAALRLYQTVGERHGEAVCTRRLGDIALARFDLEGAHRHYEAAQSLYNKIGAILGEAICVKSLGDIAFRRADLEGARQSYEAALRLFQRTTSVVGEAGCIKSLGDIALARFDVDEARRRFESALPLYQKVGSVDGEASCIQGLGDIAFARSDHDGARRRYEAALPLYQKVGSVPGEANCILSLGDIDEAEGKIVSASKRWREALAFYARIPQPPVHCGRARAPWPPRRDARRSRRAS